MTRTLPLLTALLVACTGDVPATPSFQQDVMPILAANCVRCHGTEPLSAPAYLRLDAYDDLVIREASLSPGDPACMASEPDPGCYPELKLGAAGIADTIASRVAADDGLRMPPRFPIDDYQIEILERWAALGAPRGTPRAGNRPPVATLGSIVGDDIEVVVADADRDVVGGALLVDVGAEVHVVGAISSGRARVTWNLAGVAPGTYPLSAQIDDGAEPVVVELGTFTVEAP